MGFKPFNAKHGEQTTICDDCGNSNLAHDKAVWTQDGASYCPTCRPHTATEPDPLSPARVEAMAREYCRITGLNTQDWGYSDSGAFISILDGLAPKMREFIALQLASERTKG